MKAKKDIYIPKLISKLVDGGGLYLSFQGQAPLVQI